jgi:hypothetical protein
MIETTNQINLTGLWYVGCCAFLVAHRAREVPLEASLINSGVRIDVVTKITVSQRHPQVGLLVSETWKSLIGAELEYNTGFINSV